MTNSIHYFSLLIILICFNLLGQKSKEVMVSNAYGDLYGTLTLPKTKSKKIPVALIIAGSGPTDRDGNNPYMRNNSLKMLSDSLVSMGVATLRYDKQGIAKSAEASTDEINLTIQNFANDAMLWIDFLSNQKKLSRISVIGHSEGACLALLVAKEKKIDFVISIAGAGRTIDKVMIEQLNAQDENLGNEAKLIFERIKSNSEIGDIDPNLQGLFRPSIIPFLYSWIQFDPSQMVSDLNIPVHVIQGNKDLQVSIEDAQLLKGENTHVSLHIIEGMNHIFKYVEGGRDENMLTYVSPTIPIISELIEVLRGIYKGN